jgi:long-chain acyl-CoA synthetase
LIDRPWLRQYPPGVPHDIGPLQYASLGGMMEESARRFHARPAFSSFGATVTYASVDRASRALAGYLQQRCGMQPGERLAIMLPNLVQYPVALFAAFRAGLVVVNCNPLYTSRELHEQLADSQATAILVLDHATATLDAALAGTAVRVVIVTRLGDLLPPMRGAMLDFAARHVRRMPAPVHIHGALRFVDALAEGARLPLASVRRGPDDVAFIQYTGGTTGVPKGAMLLHRNVVANLQQIAAWIGHVLEQGRETVVTALPLYHVFALTVNLLTFFRLGACNVLIADPRDVRGLVKTIRAARYSVITGVSTLYKAMLEAPGIAAVDTSRLKVAVSGGMPQERRVAERWMALTGKPLVEGWGLTETSPLLTANRLDIRAFTGSVGLPMPSTEIVVRDDDGAPLPSGEPGELCARGPQVMKGYWQRPADTAAVLDVEGWLRTGDIGTLDERGYVRILDRRKDVIVVSGFKVFPNEVEEVAATHPGVAEAAVVGVPDVHSGEAVKLVVVKRMEGVTAEEIVAHCAAQLTPYKVPRIVQFRTAPLPRTLAGKPLRRVLRDEGAAAAAGQGAAAAAGQGAAAKGATGSSPAS